MKKLVFMIDIIADKQKVWNTMLDADTYQQWVEPSWPGSKYFGNWEQGQSIRFLASSGEGTLALLEEVRPHEVIKATHEAVILKDGSLDRESDIAKGWVGTMESYYFTRKNGKTEVRVEINTSPAWEKMFSDGWPAALAKLKELSEKQ